MTISSGDRSEFFPAIEKKHGKPVSHWLKQLTTLKGPKCEQRMAILRYEPCANQTSTNTDVMQIRITGPQCSAEYQQLRD